MTHAKNQMIDIEAIEALTAQMNALPPKEKTKFAAKEAVAKSAEAIRSMLNRGYSPSEVHEVALKVYKAYNVEITESTLLSYLRAAEKASANDAGTKTPKARGKRKAATPETAIASAPAPADDAGQTAEPMPDVADHVQGEDAMDMQPETADASLATEMTTVDTTSDAASDDLNPRIGEMMNADDDAPVADVSAEIGGPVGCDPSHTTSDTEDL